MSESLESIPVGPGDVAAVASDLTTLGMPAEFAKLLADQLYEQGQRQAAELEELVSGLEALGHRACEQRDAWRELAEVWSAESMQHQQNALEFGRRMIGISLLLKEALDWLASFDHEAALKIRVAAEAV